MRSRCSAAAIWLLFACAGFGGCTDDSARLQSTLAAAQQQASATPASDRRLFYIGLALYSEPWSENDVVDLGDQLRSDADYSLVTMIASNLGGTAGQYPVADDATISSLIRNAVEQARPTDIVFVHISTHGGHGVLARKVGGNLATALPSRTLAALLAPLAPRPTVLIISACYSGSLIGDLNMPDRIIITAARADRSSFGCSPDAQHTFFGEAELRAFGRPNRSLHQVFVEIRSEVARMEHEKGYSPSEPQASVGADAAGLYNSPTF